jgi:hypothetical protein
VISITDVVGGDMRASGRYDFTAGPDVSDRYCIVHTEGGVAKNLTWFDGDEVLKAREAFDRRARFTETSPSLPAPTNQAGEMTQTFISAFRGETII